MKQILIECLSIGLSKHPISKIIVSGGLTKKKI